MTTPPLFTLTLLLAVAACAAADPLPNAGFEGGEQEWVITENVSQIVAQAAHTGTLGLRVGRERYNPAGSSVTSVRLPVTPGQQLTLRFWARGKTATSGVYLFFYTAEGKTVSDPQLKASGGNPMCAVKETDGAWHEYALPVAVPATAAGVAIWVHAFSGSVGVTDFDDFPLTGIPAEVAPLVPVVGAVHRPARAVDGGAVEPLRQSLLPFARHGGALAEPVRQHQRRRQDRADRVHHEDALALTRCRNRDAAGPVALEPRAARLPLAGFVPGRHIAGEGERQLLLGARRQRSRRHDPLRRSPRIL